MSLPSVHPRHRIVSEASYKIATAINQAVREHDLTYAEITTILSQEILGWMKYAIREERK